MSIARGNELKTTSDHEKSFRPDVKRVISSAGDRVREGCCYGDLQERQRSERAARSGSRGTPTLLPRIGQGCPERRCEPQEVEEVEASERRGEQDPRAITVVERDECFGRRADLRLIAVDQRRDDEEADELETTCAPQVFPEQGGVVPAR